MRLVPLILAAALAALPATPARADAKRMAATIALQGAEQAVSFGLRKFPLVNLGAKVAFHVAGKNLLPEDQRTYVHAVPGRLRLRPPPSARAHLPAIRDLLLRQKGVLDVSINPDTGSLLVHHQKKVKAGRLLKKLAQEGYYDPARTKGLGEAMFDTATGMLGFLL